MRKDFLVFYIHLVVDLVRIFFPTGEGVSLTDLGVPWPNAPSKGMLA